MMRKLVNDWGQALVLLAAVAALFAWGFSILRADIARVEDGLTTLVIENQRAINALGREVSELRGELKGRDLIAGMEGG